MGIATIPSNSKEQKHRSNGCLNTGVRKIYELTFCAYAHAQLPGIDAREIYSQKFKDQNKISISSIK